jgi:isoleucyl-tRNA synthetase
MTGTACCPRSMASAPRTSAPSTSTSARTALYCDRPRQPAPPRRAHGAGPACTAASAPGLRPVLVFTAEEAWQARFGAEAESVHLQPFPDLPENWRDEALAAKWAEIRRHRKLVTGSLEDHRRDGSFGSSLQAAVTLTFAPNDPAATLDAATWAETLIVSQVTLAEGAETSLDVTLAPGAKCERCWKVLPEVGASAAHPTLCRRCESVVVA